MVRKQTDKKLISFTKLPLVIRLVQDEAEIENISESAVFEHHVLDSFLPRHKDARFWVESWLYNEDGGIGETLDTIFCSNAAGINWDAVHDNLLPVVQFALQQQCLCRSSGIKTKELSHFISQLDSVYEKLVYCYENCEDKTKKRKYKSESEIASALLDQAKRTPDLLRFSNVYTLLLNSWDDFKNWTITYRLLSDLAILETNWRNTPETRIELLNILKKVSDEWLDDEEKEE